MTDFNTADTTETTEITTEAKLLSSALTYKHGA